MWWQYQRMTHFFSFTPGVVTESKAMQITVLVPGQGQRQPYASFLLLPHQISFTYRARLFCPLLSFSFFFFFLSFSIGKSQQEFLDLPVSGRPWLLLQVPVLLPAHCKKHTFLVISGLQEEGPTCTFSLATNLGKCPNTPTSLCLSRKVGSWA